MTREHRQGLQHLKGWAKQLSGIDSPSGLLNRHGWVTLAAKDLQRAARNGQRASTLLIGVDGLSKVMDQFGYAVREQALQCVAEILESQLRPGDLLGRWTDSRFILFLSAEDSVCLPLIAERLRQAVEATPLLAGEEVLRLTISGGGATVSAETGTLHELDRLIALAEQRLAQGGLCGPNQLIL